MTTADREISVEVALFRPFAKCDERPVEAAPRGELSGWAEEVGHFILVADGDSGIFLSGEALMD